MKTRILSLALMLTGIVCVLFLTACDAVPDVTKVDSVTGADRAFLGNGAPPADVGAVFGMSNDAGGNKIIRFNRKADGKIDFSGGFPTGGLGTGAGLGSQGGLVLAGKLLFAVNAGSDDISVFRVGKRTLTLTDLEPSGGEQPISIAVHNHLVYVLNAAGAGHVTGFRLSQGGQLVAIPDSTRNLSGADPAGPAQVGFSADGSVLVVTQKPTNEIVTYPVGADGLLKGPIVNASNGQTPFGFSFTNRNVLIVSEAFGGGTDASAVSSYFVDASGMLQLISGSVPNTETAACWIAIPTDGRFAYTTNTGSGSVSAYEVDAKGSLTLRDARGVTGDTGMGSGPIDMAISRDNRYLYTLNGGNQTISGFEIKRENGGLVPIQTIENLPMSTVGLAAQ